MAINWKDVAHHQRYIRRLAEQQEVRLKARIADLEAENARLRAALVEIEQYSNSLMGWAAPYGDSVFLKIIQPGHLARKALAE